MFPSTVDFCASCLNVSDCESSLYLTSEILRNQNTCTHVITQIKTLIFRTLLVTCNLTSTINKKQMYRKQACIWERKSICSIFFLTKQVLSFSCHSSIGRDTGPQNLVLGSSCYYIGVILHELNHAVGFFHEQSRYDRDDYILVNWENIQNGIIFQDLYSITLFLIPRFLLSIESLTKKSDTD